MNSFYLELLISNDKYYYVNTGSDGACKVHMYDM